MRLQETPDEIPEGGTPHTVSLLMHDKLVDAGKPGDRVEVRLCIIQDSFLSPLFAGSSFKITTAKIYVIVYDYFLC